MKDAHEQWEKAYSPWGTPCAVVIKDGKIVKAHCGIGGHIKEDQFHTIKLCNAEEHLAAKISLL